MCGTRDDDLCYKGKLRSDRVLDICACVHVDMARSDLDKIRSTSGYLFKLFGGVVSWLRKGQSIVEPSTIEIEYMETIHEKKEELWLLRLCLGMGF